MEHLLALVSALVRIPSMNPMGRGRAGEEYAEASLAHFVADYCRRRGVPAELQDVTPGRPNVVAFIDAGAEATVLLEAHLDTVQADGMVVAPFEGRIEHGRLQGRGACDTKASLAVFMDVVCSFAAERNRLRYNLAFLATVDEEYQFTGARAAVEGGLRADFGICGEPTRLHIVRAHKGVTRWRVWTRGKAAHSAYPEQGQNAIFTMGHILRALEHHANALTAQIPHEVLGVPTLSVGVIEGGQAVNVVPASCSIEIDRRTLPGETLETILGGVQRALEGTAGWTMDAPHLHVAGMDVPDNNAYIARLETAIASCTRQHPVVEGAQYATDAGVFNTAGIPCIVFGPGDIADAHTAGESIDVAEVLTAREILGRFLS